MLGKIVRPRVISRIRVICLPIIEENTIDAMDSQHHRTNHLLATVSTHRLTAAFGPESSVVSYEIPFQKNIYYGTHECSVGDEHVNERNSVTSHGFSMGTWKYARQNLLDDVIRQPKQLTLPDPVEFFLSLLSNGTCHARLPSEQLDHAKDAHH